MESLRTRNVVRRERRIRMFEIFGEMDSAEEINKTDWTEYIKTQCIDNEEIARAVRRKGKSLKGCIGHLLRWSFNARYKMDRDIIKAAGISAASVEMGIPGMGRAKKLIKEYYLEQGGGEK